MINYSVVIPTVGRPSLHAVLDALLTGTGPLPAEIIIVDDRRSADGEAPHPFRWMDHRTDRTAQMVHPPGQAPPVVRVLRSGGRGPAAARNVGWRAASTEWVAFLDDDVLPAADWAAALHADLAGLPPDVAGSQARIRVPQPAGRRPTDWERGTAGLARARWITADIAYRRAALAEVGGFDERFPRAYREDADLALRLFAAGHRLVRGQRTTTHPVRPAGFWTSVRVQAGNADDALMWRLHGRAWRAAAGEGPGRLRWHVVTTAAGVTALALSTARRTRPAATGAAGTTARRARAAARMAGLAWAALTADFALRRIMPGPRTAPELARMAVTSVVIPPVACAHRLAGELRWAGRSPRWMDHVHASIGAMVHPPGSGCDVQRAQS